MTAVISFALLGVFLTAGPAQAEPEPNDTMATALPLAVGTTGIPDGQIVPAGDYDYYKFDAPDGGGTFVAEVFDVASDLGTVRLYIYNAAGAQIGNDSACDNGSGNVCARAEVTVSVGGTYFVRVNAYSASATGTYKVRVLPSYDEGLVHGADGEPDDYRSLAEPIDVGLNGSLSRTIYPRNPAFKTVAADIDVVRFEAPTAGTFVAEVFDVAADLSTMRMYVYNSAGTLLGSDTSCSNGSGNVCARVEVSVSVAGTYFVRAYPYSSTASGSYKIRVLPAYDQGLTWDATGEPNDYRSLAQPISVGREGALSRTIYPRDPAFKTVGADVDVVRFDAPSAGTFVVELFAVASDLGTMRLYVYNSAGTVLASDTSCANGTGNVCARATINVSVAGTYFARAYPYSSSASGAYKVRVLPRYDQGLTWDRTKEVNDTTDLAFGLRAGRTLDQRIYARNSTYKTVAADADFFRFQARANRDYVVTTAGVAASVDPLNLYVYNSAGTLVGSDVACDNGLPGECNRVAFRPSLTGTYFFKVRPYTSTESGTYSICLRLSAESCT